MIVLNITVFQLPDLTPVVDPQDNKLDITAEKSKSKDYLQDKIQNVFLFSHTTTS